MTTTTYDGLDRVLRAAPPYRLLETLQTELAARFGAGAVDLLLADYALRVLRSVGGAGEPVSLRNGPAGRAFGSQEPVTTPEEPSGSARLHLPVTARGDRLGVLELRLDRRLLTPRTVRDLRDIAVLVAHEVLVAERDTDVFRRARRTVRLTLAAEIQWDLLPGRAFSCPEYSIGALLQPAYAVRGDNFDWTASSGELVLSVMNGMGEGSRAALLTSLAVNALRNARRAGIGLADQARLADQALYAEHRGRNHVDTLLLRIDSSTGRGEVVDAGSPRLWRQRDGKLTRVEFEEQLPLGMFEETPYTAQDFEVLPGDRLVCVSDGVYSPLRDGLPFGERALARAVHGARLLPAASVPGAVLAELSEYYEGEQDDDALVLCLDWHGPGGRTGAGGDATADNRGPTVAE